MKFIAAIMVLGLGLSLNAGMMDKIKIKKAVAEAEIKINTELSNVKSACGNKSLEVSVNWDKWGTYGLNADKHQTAIANVATLIVNEVFTTMADACKDADYKAVIGEATKIDITGKDKFDEMYIDFKYDKGTLSAKLNGDAYGSWKNKELFMAAW